MAKKKISRLEVLKDQEAELSAEVIKLESEHKSLAKKHRDRTNEARDIQVRVDELVNELGKCRKRFEEIATINNELIRKMNKVSGDRAEKLASLDAVRAEITSLTVVSIAVYKDCTFEIVEGSFAFDLSSKEEEISTLTHQLMDREICEDLTARQIRTLSRLLILKTSVAQKLEFIFDDSALETAYLASYQKEQPLSS